jgi:hypothetical protein
MAMNKKSKGSSLTSSACRKPRGKAIGTRVGVLSDWRQASGKSGKMPSERRSDFRDGR